MSCFYLCFTSDSPGLFALSICKPVCMTAYSLSACYCFSLSLPIVLFLFPRRLDYSYTFIYILFSVHTFLTDAVSFVYLMPCTSCMLSQPRLEHTICLLYSQNQSVFFSIFRRKYVYYIYSLLSRTWWLLTEICIYSRFSKSCLKKDLFDQHQPFAISEYVDCFLSLSLSLSLSYSLSLTLSHTHTHSLDK